MFTLVPVADRFTNARGPGDLTAFRYVQTESIIFLISPRNQPA